jgi:pimeloyl-ACP methyl ester carboxylesterase
MRRRARARAITVTGVAFGVFLAFGFFGSLVHVAPAVGATARSVPIAWHACSDGFRCGTLTVPVDDAAPAGSTLDLAVLRKPARHPNAKIGTLVFNPGGPGAPGLSFLTAIAGTLPDRIQDRFDLVAFDPRGVGQSSAVECEDSLDPLFDQSFQPATAAERNGLVDAVRALADACAQRSGAILAHVSTVDAVHDLERLRLALGEDQLSFVGYSYGTFLGATYASTYPDRVRAFVLDGPVDPTMSAREVTLAQARGFEHSLDDFLADCSAHPGCAFHHDGHAANAYDALRTRAARSPIPADGVPGRGLNRTRFDAAVLQQLYLGRPAWPALATALAAAADGDASVLLGQADAFVGRDGAGRDDHALEAFWAVSCLDGPAIGGLAAAAALEAQAIAVAPRLGAFIVNNSLPCSVWPVAPVAAPGRLEAKGAPPILVVGTTDDPATPLAQARSLAAALQHGRLLVAEGEQHTSFNVGTRCVDRTVTRYLVDLRVPEPGTRC